ncbi:MAG: T9SS type A sorting domain-containing protein, partial [Candidatus Kryptoniota bacterium]
LNNAGIMSLKIYNVLGQLVKVVDEGYKPAGTYIYNINMDNFGSGVYFYTLTQGSNSITKKMILMK